MDGCRDDVVGRLAFVYVVVRVNGVAGSKLSAEGFDGDVGDDLVGVHVGRRARAGLEDVDHEGIVEFAVDDSLGGRDDGGGTFGVEGFKIEVDLGGALFDLSDGPDEGATEAEVADGEVEFGAAGVCAVISICGDV